MEPAGSNIIPLPQKEGFFPLYFSYIGSTEAPKIYNRWMAISMVGAILARKIWIPFGHSSIYPNQFIWLVGIPGARKGTALGPIKNLLHSIKFNKLSPQRISPEMFISQMQKINAVANIEELDDLEIENLAFDTPCEMYVISDEIADFLRGSTDFIKVITNLYDNLPYYSHPKLHGKSVYVNEPTLNFTGGITPEDITLSIPIESVGQGFFSRIILVYSEPTGLRITIPEPPNEGAKTKLAKLLEEITKLSGPLEITQESKELLDTIYHRFPGLTAINFQHYNSRRFTHLLKLTICLAAMDLSMEIKPQHILEANTILHATENRMPKALGEFGRSRNAAVAHKIIELLKAAGRPVSVREIWHHVVNDLSKLEDLILIIRGLQYAEKIQQMDLGGKSGWLPLYKTETNWHKGLIISNFLYPEEI